MAAHRYWRAVGLVGFSGEPLDISEFQLLAGTTRVDASATLTANVAPTSGSLSLLQDGSTASSVIWSAALVRAGITLSWDFGGSPADVTDMRVGSGALLARFLYFASLQFSDDGTNWSAYLFGTDGAAGPPPVGFKWPGVRALTTSSPRGLWTPYDRGTNNSGTLNPAKDTITQASGQSSFMFRGFSMQNSGVRQFEILLGGAGALSGGLLGVATRAASNSLQLASQTGSPCAWSWAPASRIKYANNTPTTAYGATMTAGQVCGVVVDFAAQSITFYLNGVSQGVAYTGQTAFSQGLMPAWSCNGTSIQTATINCGGTPFAYPISGATAWDSNAIIDTAPSGASVGPIVAVASAASNAITMGLTRIRNIILGRKDYLTGVTGQGIGRVRGTTLDHALPVDVPYPCRVALIREADTLKIREQWSKADGSYDFQWVDEVQSYSVLAYYADHGKQAVVADGITLANGKVELMP